MEEEVQYVYLKRLRVGELPQGSNPWEVIRVFANSEGLDELQADGYVFTIKELHDAGEDYDAVVAALKLEAEQIADGKEGAEQVDSEGVATSKDNA